MEIRIRAAGESDTGRVRRSNQDAFGFDLDRGLFVVCDGVGGASAGEVASRTAVDSVLNRFPQTTILNGGSELNRAIQAANRSIVTAAEREPAYSGMATTIVSAFFDGQRMWIAHVGDSRAYLLRGQSLHRLTDDHSALSQYLRDGRSKNNGKVDLQHLDSVLTQALGASELIVPEVVMVQVELGDCFLLASDGVTKALTNSEMLSMMLASSSPEQACHQLILAANHAGGHDNATCIMVEID